MQATKALNCVIFKHLMTITNTEKLGELSCYIRSLALNFNTPDMLYPTSSSLSTPGLHSHLPGAQATRGKGRPKDSGC